MGMVRPSVKKLHQDKILIQVFYCMILLVTPSGIMVPLSVPFFLVIYTYGTINPTITFFVHLLYSVSWDRHVSTQHLNCHFFGLLDD